MNQKLLYFIIFCIISWFKLNLQIFNQSIKVYDFAVCMRVGGFEVGGGWKYSGLSKLFLCLKLLAVEYNKSYLHMKQQKKNKKTFFRDF